MEIKTETKNQASEPKIIQMKVSDIKVARSLRVSAAAVKALAADIELNGLINAIQVDSDGNLVCGRTRLAAIDFLGWDEISAVVVSSTTEKSKFMEHSENFYRRELTSAEFALSLGQQKQAYEQMYPETKHGTAGGKAKGKQNTGAETASVNSFKDYAANLQNISGRSVQVYTKLYVDLGESVLNEILDKSLTHNLSDLQSLVKLDIATRRKVLDSAIHNKSLGDALANIKEAKPETKPDDDKQLEFKEPDDKDNSAPDTSSTDQSDDAPKNTGAEQLNVSSEAGCSATADASANDKKDEKSPTKSIPDKTTKKSSTNNRSIGAQHAPKEHFHHIVNYSAQNKEDKKTMKRLVSDIDFKKEPEVVCFVLSKDHPKVTQLRNILEL